MGISFRKPTSVYLFSTLLIFFTLALFSQAASNTIAEGQSISDGEIMCSSGQSFALGFFSPGNTTQRYVGIWYYQISVLTVVWIANSDNPISGGSGVLRMFNGNLIIQDGNNTVWSTDISSPSINTTAILMEDGNLVVSDSEDVGDNSLTSWESFSFPTDTYLPDMKAYMNNTGESHIFTSWRGPSDPSEGSYMMGLDTRGSPQIVIWDQSERHWRSGYWNLQIFTGVPGMSATFQYGFKLIPVSNDLSYLTYTMTNSSLIMRFWLRWDGVVEQLIWDERRSLWNASMTEPANECGKYNRCGNFGLCSVSKSPICTCMKGFEPMNRDQEDEGNWSGGCIRRTLLQCQWNGTNDGFSTVNGVKLPDFADTTDAKNLEECAKECLLNCSCIAHTFVTGIGCMMWGGDLVDIELFHDGGGNSLYIRLAHSELGKKRLSTAAIVAIITAGMILFGVIMWISWWYQGKQKAFSNPWQTRENSMEVIPDLKVSMSQGFSADATELSIEKSGDCPQLPLFGFNSILVATEDFANKNKLGQGGFGPVYKGILPGGQEIAVKRLSKWSGQGLDEFKNEIILILKLQHRNLVRLLGCCIEGEEKMLIYEYMPNNSLDTFLFDPLMKAQLDWSKRFTIIEGIARGLLYLHRDSRLRIIHRDLKASNILLDEELNPKISDFGMARIFGGNQNEANTNRIVGTYGYMSPEYAMDGLFSIKSDVYSFGVLLLEIVSGQKNSSFRTTEGLNLIRHAWNLFSEGKGVELVDTSIVESCADKEVNRCIHVAMLCVQVSAVYRPTMSSVLLMLESENATLPMPKQPDTSITSRSSTEMDSFLRSHDITTSSNDVTVTQVDGR